MKPARQTIEAILGPTNTGKTWFALERMKTHADGVIGFPLRLLARETYDRMVAQLGVNAVALVTGEEKIIPKTARFFLCTVEAMPLDRPFSFIAIDEIQLCADPDRGHIFTDRLLHARGTQETLFLGSDTMRGIIEALLPECRITTRPRLSQLSYGGYKKLSRMPRRSAVVAFTIEDVYTLADQLRQRRGGTAVVLGALSPRTRNAQVAMYQAGEVDYLVATDAIGMGLNMDIHHVALAAARKYDGAQARKLTAPELGQIAGRAGRHMRDGTFGTTDRLTYLPEDVVEAIESHHFDPVQHIIWRNVGLDFSSPIQLLHGLTEPPPHPLLTKGYQGEDQLALESMVQNEIILARATDARRTRLLWDVCQIPDFRKSMSDTHHALLATIFMGLCDGHLNDDFMAGVTNPLDDIAGDADTLMARLAHIRTWTYVAHRAGWVKNADTWQSKTRGIEDRLSDALHQALMQRFVDKRAAALGQKLEEDSPLLAGIQKDGTVVVEGHSVGKLTGLKFEPEDSLRVRTVDTQRVLTAARKALKPEIQRRIKTMLDTTTGHFSLQDNGQICWQPLANNPLPGDVVATLAKGATLLAPVVKLADTDEVGGTDRNALQDQIETWLAAHIKTVLAPLFALTADEESLQGTARGIGFQLFENLGVMHRNDLGDLITGLTPETRAGLRKLGVRMGPILVFLPALVKPAAIKMRASLWALWHDRVLPMHRPADGRVSEVITEDTHADRNFYRMIGYPIFGPRACRIDMLDRVITDVYDSAKDGIFEAKHQYAEWLGANLDDLHAILSAMGHRRLHDKPADETAEAAVPEVTVEPAPVAEDAPAAEGETPATESKPAKPTVPLVKFMLKRGSMADRPQHKRHHHPVHKPAKPAEGHAPVKPREDKKPNQPQHHARPRKQKAEPREAIKAQRYEASAPSGMGSNPFGALQALKDKLAK